MPGRIPMTARQRAGLLALPDNEAMVIRHHGLDAEDLAAIGTARTPATRLGYALQLCCLRYPGRHLRRGELLPAVMLDHIAEQVVVETDVITALIPSDLYPPANQPSSADTRTVRVISASRRPSRLRLTLEAVKNK